MSREEEIAKYVDAYRHSHYGMGAARLQAARRDLAGLTGSLLDVGCGRGEVLKLARECGLSPVKGTEVVPELLRGDEVIYAQAHALPFEAGSFDHVTCFDVLEHLTPEDTVPALKELARVARHTVTVTVADYPHVFNGVDLHVNRRSYPEWLALLRKTFGDSVQELGAAGASRSYRVHLTDAFVSVSRSAPVAPPSSTLTQRRSIEELRGRHAGETFIILGGGQTLAEEMRYAPPGIRISANDHGFKWGQCDYIVAMDDIPDRVRKFGVPVIGRHPSTADYLMSPVPGVTWSGANAVQAAAIMGASQVVLAGMTLYQTTPGEPQAGTPPFAEHVRCWEVIRTTVGVGIRALGGPLVWMFGYYDPDKPAQPAPQVSRPVMTAGVIKGVRVRAIANGSCCGRRYVRGAEMIIRTDEFGSAFAAGLVERL